MKKYLKPIALLAALTVISALLPAVFLKIQKH